MPPLSDEVVWLLLLALPVACVSWTVTHEEVVREPREWLAECGRTGRSWWVRKLCYAFTCEYCFSHYVAAAALALTRYRLLLGDWRGYALAWLALVAVANVYLSAYGRLRVEIRHERAQANQAEARPRRAG